MKKSRVGFTDNMSNKIDGFSSCSEFQGVKGFKSILPCSAPGRDQYCGAGRGGVSIPAVGYCGALGHVGEGQRNPFRGYWGEDC